MALRIRYREHPEYSNLKRSKTHWSGYGSQSLPPRKHRKPHNHGNRYTGKWQVTPDILKSIENLSARGLNREQIAHCLDISADTLQKRCRESAEVEALVTAAIKKGRGRGIALITHTLFEQAQQPRQVADRIFWLKNNAGYKDAYSQELTGRDGGPIETTVKREYSDQERAARLASILAAVQKRSGTKLKLKRRK